MDNVVFGKFIADEKILNKLFTEIGPRMKDRNGGYTRVLKIGFRQGDAADMVILELVDYKLDTEAKDEKSEAKAKKPAKSAEEKKEPAKKAAAEKKPAAKKTSAAKKTTAKKTAEPKAETADKE